MRLKNQSQKPKPKLLVIALVLVALLAGVQHNKVSAAADGVTIKPALYTVNATAGQDEADVAVTIENDTARDVVIKPSATDFTSSDINGSILLRNSSDAQHGLQDNVVFSSPSLAVKAKQSVVLKLTIKDITKLTPGGHYTFVRYSVDAVDAQGRGQGVVSLNQNLSTFLFLTTPGKIVYDLQANVSGLPPAIFSLPASADVVISNIGNTQIDPHGSLTVSGPFHRLVGQSLINSNSSLILPGSTRLFQVSVPLKNQLSLLPGKYNYDFYYRSNNANDIQHIHKEAIYIGWPTILVVVAIIVLIVVLIRRRNRRRLKPVAAKKVTQITVKL